VGIACTLAATQVGWGSSGSQGTHHEGANEQRQGVKGCMGQLAERGGRGSHGHVDPSAGVEHAGLDWAHQAVERGEEGAVVKGDLKRLHRDMATCALID
jgi:hypothetical protein